MANNISFENNLQLVKDYSGENNGVKVYDRDFGAITVEVSGKSITLESDQVLPTIKMLIENYNPSVKLSSITEEVVDIIVDRYHKLPSALQKSTMYLSLDGLENLIDSVMECDMKAEIYSGSDSDKINNQIIKEILDNLKDHSIQLSDDPAYSGQPFVDSILNDTFFLADTKKVSEVFGYGPISQELIDQLILNYENFKESNSIKNDALRSMVELGIKILSNEGLEAGGSPSSDDYIAVLNFALMIDKMGKDDYLGSLVDYEINKAYQLGAAINPVPGLIYDQEEKSYVVDYFDKAAPAVMIYHFTNALFNILSTFKSYVTTEELSEFTGDLWNDYKG